MRKREVTDREEVFGMLARSRVVRAYRIDLGSVTGKRNLPGSEELGFPGWNAVSRTATSAARPNGSAAASGPRPAALGYEPERVTKILLTHKHGDHSGELRSFPNAKVYVNEDEVSAEELQGIDNLVPVSFTDGPYHNFPESQKIADGIYFIRAKGHAAGNSLVVAEDDGLFYMFEADVTYVDEALYENKLSVVFDDLPAARDTLDRVREFVAANPTVYLGTHTPQGYESLEAKRVIDLANPPETIPAGEVTFKTRTGKYVCSVCGYVYDPAVGDESQGIAPGTPFEDLPDDWHCPRCKQTKERFNAA